MATHVYPHSTPAHEARRRPFPEAGIALWLLLVLVLFLFLPTARRVQAQSTGVNRGTHRIHIYHSAKEIVIDGVLDEDPWGSAEETTPFTRVTPTDTGYAAAQTVVKVTYDDEALYVGAVCYDPVPGKRPIQSLRRDFNFSDNDNFMFFIDPYNDQMNGFAFGVSAAGVQRDGSMSNGSNTVYTWDTKWRSAVTSYERYWIVEIRIPFRSIRYLEGVTEWGINFGRLDLKTNEKSAWAPVPRQFPHSNLAFGGTLLWDRPLRKSGSGFSIIPYLTGKTTRDNETHADARWSGNTGFDGKMVLSTSMNLDLTVNPDYSQVEEDRQVTNLDRFELNFPERRQFFLENTDLFANLGSSGSQPFFSRRIGLNVPVVAGARLSGQIGEDWRIGLLDVQTGVKDVTPATNVSAAVLQRQVFHRSNVQAFLINKETTGDYDAATYSGRSYNRVAGLEYNLASTDNRWFGKAYVHRSFYPGSRASASTAAANLVYSSPFLTASLTQSWVGTDYSAEVGFIRRTGYYRTAPQLKYTFYPAKRRVLSHGPILSFEGIYDTRYHPTDREIQVGYTLEWHNRNELTLRLSDHYVLLRRPHDPTNMGGQTLPEGTDYEWKAVDVTFSSDSRRLLQYTFGAGYGSYYNGERAMLVGSVNYRIQPHGSLELNATYNDISLPEPYNSARLLLIGPRFDITFTDNLFLTTLIQYNNQIDNVNVNLRLQWRFGPVSDLYIVYTANAYADDFRNKYRGLVFKVSYWFN